MRRRMQESSKGAINHEKLKLPTQVTKIGQNFPKIRWKVIPLLVLPVHQTWAIRPKVTPILLKIFQETARPTD